MKSNLMIDKNNVELINEIGPELATTYKVAFAGPPWFEASKCETPMCELEFSASMPGQCCPGCDTALAEAYSTQDLVNGWQNIIENDNAMMEVSLTDNAPQRATIARPTNPMELYERKYPGIDIGTWLLKTLPPEFVWIEDTFANRDKQPSGNLKDRGKTLDTIFEYYEDLDLIVIRTLSSAVIAATFRDKPKETMIYTGTVQTGYDTKDNQLRIDDRRTLLTIKRS